MSGVSRPLGTGLFVLLDAHGVELASLASRCESCQGLVQSSSSCLRPRMSTNVIVAGPCLGRLLWCALSSTSMVVMGCIRPIWSSSIVLSPALVGLFSYWSPATENTPWTIRWSTAGVYWWSLSVWYKSSSGWSTLNPPHYIRQLSLAHQ